MLNNFHRKKCLLWSKSSRSWLSFYCHGEWESLEICRNVGSSAIWGEWVEWISEWRKNKSNKNNAEEFRYSNRQISDVKAWNCLLFFEFLQLNLDSAHKHCSQSKLWHFCSDIESLFHVHMMNTIQKRHNFKIYEVPIRGIIRPLNR